MTEEILKRPDRNISESISSRLHSIDILRGLVMVLMTLDHTRAFFSNASFSPLDLNQSNITLFMTRWITHLCAPTFIFLAGISAYLALKRGKNQKELSETVYKLSIKKNFDCKLNALASGGS
ncbi:MAG: heparan-alpha-glucosaminide N-acetyltransferase domain-containing protein [Prochloraceae cyanobacterium]|nr:heparan-alpha-glucosaminide N-acetyltransferase domain-containing protein [Prochloraceae cyanobacterium]